MPSLKLEPCPRVWRLTTANPENNVFNSTIAGQQVDGVGVDLDTFNVGEGGLGILKPGDTMASLVVGSGDGLVGDPRSLAGGGESVFLGYVVLAVDTYTLPLPDGGCVFDGGYNSGPDAATSDIGMPDEDADGGFDVGQADAGQDGGADAGGAFDAGEHGDSEAGPDVSEDGETTDDAGAVGPDIGGADVPDAESKQPCPDGACDLESNDNPPGCGCAVLHAE